jgi:hypothetical protein
MLVDVVMDERFADTIASELVEAIFIESTPHLQVGAEAGLYRGRSNFRLSAMMKSLLERRCLATLRGMWMRG